VQFAPPIPHTSGITALRPTSSVVSTADRLRKRAGRRLSRFMAKRAFRQTAIENHIAQLAARQKPSRQPAIVAPLNRQLLGSSMPFGRLPPIVRMQGKRTQSAQEFLTLKCEVRSRASA